MSMIFPGMDPYLEDPLFWFGFHNRMIVYIADYLQPLLRPRYIAALEERVFVEGPNREISPDVWIRRDRGNPPNGTVALAEVATPIRVRVPALEIHESYINIVDVRSQKRVVTAIELVSPTNKYAGPGRTLYVEKQVEVRASSTHLVEIDLHRTGPHVLAVPEWVARAQGNYNYLISVNRAQDKREVFDLYLVVLRQRLPRVPVPLAEADADVSLDLQEVFAKTYDAGLYRERLLYDAPCRPPLPPEDQTWADQLIEAARRQNGA